jgi:hypothetical protein
MESKTEFTQVKGLSAPARRALAGAGYQFLEQLTEVRENDLAPLHGMGPTGIRALGEALKGRGLSFKSD